MKKISKKKNNDFKQRAFSFLNFIGNNASRATLMDQPIKKELKVKEPKKELGPLGGSLLFKTGDFNEKKKTKVR